jgi:hypothetical protein
MKSILFYLLTLVLCGALACDSKTQSPGEGAAGSSTTPTEEATETSPSESAAKPATFTKPEEPVSEGYMRVFTDGIWHYEGVLDMKAAQTMQRGEGRWMKFNENGLFAYGKYDKELRTGRWHFMQSEYILELIYDDEPSRLLGFGCQFGGEEALVLVGKGRYQTNGVQMKWDKFSDYPRQ